MHVIVRKHARRIPGWGAGRRKSVLPASAGQIGQNRPMAAAPPARRAPCAPLLALLAAGALTAGCARPFAGPKTLASVGVGVLAASAGIWVAGDRANNAGLTRAGAIGAGAGALAEIVAGTWLAASVGCRVDPDCPEAESCREIPAPPGREPFKQCLPK